MQLPTAFTFVPLALLVVLVTVMHGTGVAASPAPEPVPQSVTDIIAGLAKRTAATVPNTSEAKPTGH
ncbi:uncharacterized protein PSFLO_04552 [Pseudozyma flocculosa]|uniref:Secreted protein n=1 Tax=Pseudozyma flocculosa TaxID=84751 RepID=A0A5C3F3J1_9BASI|nr:uncharacterized protein PSFLO_04552 [Pseudozyma flocculosa]